MAEERITDIGPPHYEQFLPPVIKENYGKWDHHEILKPGVMVHVGESGDKIFTVRAASPRLLACGPRFASSADLADTYCDGLPAVHQPQQRRVPARRRVENRSPHQGPRRIRVPGGRHSGQALQHRPHPGLGPLPLGGVGRLRCGEGRDGRALPLLHRRERCCRRRCGSPTPAASTCAARCTAPTSRSWVFTPGRR